MKPALVLTGAAAVFALGFLSARWLEAVPGEKGQGKIPATGGQNSSPILAKSPAGIRSADGSVAGIGNVNQLSKRARVGKLLEVLDHVSKEEFPRLFEEVKALYLSGQLSADDFAVFLTCAGEKGSPQFLNAFLQDGGMMSKFGVTLNGFIHDYAKQAPAEVYSCLLARYGAGKIDPKAARAFLSGAMETDAAYADGIARADPALASPFLLAKAENDLRRLGFAGAVAALTGAATGDADPNSFKVSARSLGGVAAESGILTAQQYAKQLSESKVLPGTPTPFMSAFTPMLRDDFEAAFGWAKSMPPSGEKGIALNFSIAELAKSDPERALKEIEGMKDLTNEERRNVLRGLLNGLPSAAKLSGEERADLIHQTQLLLETQKNERRTQGKELAPR